MSEVPTVSSERTLPLIAAEINMIKHQTGKVFLVGAIEIGRRLREVKAQIPYGKWSKWLKESVNYSQRTAERLMRIFDAYGSWQSVSLEEGGQARELPDMNYTQAYILLGVPEDEREQFLVEIGLENMTARELQKAVNERNQAIKELKAEQLKSSKSEVEGRALENELQLIRQNRDFESVERVKEVLNAASLRAQSDKIAFIYESLNKTFNDLAWEMKNLAIQDPDTHEEYQKKVHDILERAMEII